MNEEACGSAAPSKLKTQIERSVLAFCGQAGLFAPYGAAERGRTGASGVGEDGRRSVSPPLDGPSQSGPNSGCVEGGKQLRAEPQRYESLGCELRGHAPAERTDPEEAGGRPAEESSLQRSPPADSRTHDDSTALDGAPRAAAGAFSAEAPRPPRRVIAAVSGGADSMALLRILLALQTEWNITVEACHVNHGLRGAAADADEAFVRQECEKLHVPLYVFGAVKESCLPPKNAGEDWARRLRYGFFERLVAQRGAQIATAHTLTDQAETLLFRLARGTGVHGAAGIPVQRGPYLRPLLSLTRADTEAYCAAVGQPWVTDATNLTDAYARNRLRHHALPALETVNPAAQQNLGRFCEKMARADAYFVREARRLLCLAAAAAAAVEAPGRAEAFRPSSASPRSPAPAPQAACADPTAGPWSLPVLRAADPLILESACHSLVSPVRDLEETYVRLLCGLVQQGSGAVQLTDRVRFLARDGLLLRQEQTPPARRRGASGTARSVTAAAAENPSPPGSPAASPLPIPLAALLAAGAAAGNAVDSEAAAEATLSATAATAAAPQTIAAARAADTRAAGVQPAPPPRPSQKAPLSREEITLPGGYQLQIEIFQADISQNTPLVHKKDLKNMADYAKITGSECVLRTRKAGDRFRPAGRGVSKPLKKLLNELHVPPRARSALPLLAAGETVLWLWDQGFAEGLAPDAATRTVLCITQKKTEESKA